jgi:hypothetical protein
MLDVRWKTVAVLVGQKFERLNMSLASILARSDHLKTELSKAMFWSHTDDIEGE